MNDQREAISKFRNANENWLGKLGEAFWKNVFEASGLTYVPLCDMDTSSAPMAMGKEKIVLPDFEVIDIVGVYLDSKVKKNVAYYRRRNQVRHGIDKRRFDSYRTMSERTGKPAGLALIELFGTEDKACRDDDWSGALLVQTLSKLGPGAPGISNQSHMTYWPRTAFAELDRLEPQEILDVAAGRWSMSFERGLRMMFAAPEPLDLTEQKKLW